MRPFARTFDLISSAYGWTDDQVLDLTMSRIRQTREVIWERQAETRSRDLSVREVELRTLASFMAQSEEAQAVAAQIRLLPPEESGPTERPMIPFADAQRMMSGA